MTETRRPWQLCYVLLFASALCAAMIMITSLPGDFWLLLRVRAEFEARGLRVRESHRHERLSHHSRWKVRLTGRWPESASGPTAHAVLNLTARAALARIVKERGARPPRGHCRRAGWLRADRRSHGDGLGDGAVAVVTRGPKEALVLPHAHWGKDVNHRRACTFETCFDARRPACLLPGPLRVLWYAAPFASAPANTPAVGAASISEVACSTSQCVWAVRGLQPAGVGGEPLAQLVAQPDMACVFVASEDALRKRNTVRGAATRSLSKPMPARAGPVVCLAVDCSRPCIPRCP